jgi:hypothetical protein
MPSALTRHDEAFSFMIPPPSLSAKRLSYLIRNLSPEDLHEKILEVLVDPTRPTEAKDALWESLEALGFYTTLARKACIDDAQGKMRHCVRCHATYKEVDNGLKACCIPHSPPENYRPSQMLLWYACCGVWLGPTQQLKNEFCFVGRHTGQTSVVQYNGDNLKTCDNADCASSKRELIDFTGLAVDYDETLDPEGNEIGEGDEEFQSTQPVN